MSKYDMLNDLAPVITRGDGKTKTKMDYIMLLQEAIHKAEKYDEIDNQKKLKKWYVRLYEDLVVMTMITVCATLGTLIAYILIYKLLRW